jgi:hypothetical protein
MADKELLKKVLNDLINDNQESATLALHSYLTTKTQEVVGFNHVTMNDETTNDETVNVETENDEDKTIDID